MSQDEAAHAFKMPSLSIGNMSRQKGLKDIGALTHDPANVGQ